jgi:hypothetical protein
MRTILLILHILAAGTWIGANATQLALRPAMSRHGGTTGAAWWRGTVRMGQVLYTPAAVVILITGIWLVVDSAVYDFEQAFVVIGFAMVIVGAVLGAMVFGPVGRRAADLHEAGESGAVAAVEQRLLSFGLLDTALLVVTVAAMVGKWGV